MNELQQEEQITLKLVRYLKRLSMEVETIQKQLKSGEIKIRKGKWTESETEVGHGGDAFTTSPLSTMCDKNAERVLTPTGKKLTGRKLVKIPEFETVDLENLKIRVFSAEFPVDAVVTAYQKNSTLENRFTLLIHIAALEKNVAPGDLMDLHGITSDYLMGRMKHMLEADDKQVSARFLALAFNMKFPGPSVKVGRATQQNFFNFASKREAVKAVKDQMSDGVGINSRGTRGMIVDFDEETELDREDEQRGPGAAVVEEREETASD